MPPKQWERPGGWRATRGEGWMGSDIERRCVRPIALAQGGLPHG